jgi:hypothetical protein
MSEADFLDRLEFNDKLVLSILGQKNTLFLKDKLGIQEIVNERIKKKSKTSQIFDV